MTTPPPIHSTSPQHLPLPLFIEEMCKLQCNKSDPKLNELQPYLGTAFASLLNLRQCADQLPDLSPGRWFLRAHYLSARNQTLEQLRITQNNLLILTVKAREKGDPFDILSFTAGFLNFVAQAKISPAIFQQPYELDFSLRIPEPLSPAMDGDHMDSLFAADIADPS